MGSIVNKFSTIAMVAYPETFAALTRL